MDDFLLCGLVSGKFRCDLPPVHDHDTVRHGQQFLEFGCDQQDGHSLGGPLIHQSINLVFSADIHTQCRFVQQQNFGVCFQPLGQDHLLLVASDSVSTS